MKRQISEAVWILSGEADLILNSKGEWNGSIIPRLALEIGAKVVQHDYQGQAQEGRMIATTGKEDEEESKKRKTEMKEKRKEGVVGMIRKRRKVESTACEPCEENTNQGESIALPTIRQQCGVRKRSREEEENVLPVKILKNEDEGAERRQAISPLAGEVSQQPVLPPQDRPGTESSQREAQTSEVKDKEKDKERKDIEDGNQTEEAEPKRQHISPLAGKSNLAPLERPEVMSSQEASEVMDTIGKNEDDEREVEEEQVKEEKRKKIKDENENKDSDEKDVEDGREKSDENVCMNKNEECDVKNNEYVESKDDTKDGMRNVKIKDDVKSDRDGREIKDEMDEVNENKEYDKEYERKTKTRKVAPNRDELMNENEKSVKEKKEERDEKRDQSGSTGGFITSKRGGWTPGRPGGRGSIGGKAPRKGRGRGLGGDRGKGKGQGQGGRQTSMLDFLN